MEQVLMPFASTFSDSEEKRRFMAESKKSTTLSFRIEDDLKEKLSQIAERENKTLTNKARELLAQALSLSPRKTLTENILDDVRRIDTELRMKLTTWNLELTRQMSTVSEGKHLLDKYETEIKRLNSELEEEKARTRRTQRSMVRWTAAFFLTALAGNAVAVALLVCLR